MITRLKPIPERKVKQLEEIKNLAKNYKNILVIDLTKIPNDVLQRFRKDLDNPIIIPKKRIAYKALKEVGLKNLAEEIIKINTTFALIFGNDSVFKIYAKFRKKEYRTYAKGNEIAEEDIIVPKGPTDLKPGQVMSELARFKIRARPVGGYLEIVQDVKVLEKGKVISKELASILRKLGIKAVKYRIKPILGYEDGIIVKKEDLDVDEEKIKNQLKESIQKGILLTIGLWIPTKENINILIGYVYRIARGFALEINYISKDTIKDLIIKAKNIAEKIKEKVNI